MIPHEGLHRIASGLANVDEAADILEHLRESDEAKQGQKAYRALLSATWGLVGCDESCEKTQGWLDLVRSVGAYYKSYGDKDAPKIDALGDILETVLLFRESNSDETLLAAGSYAGILSAIAGEAKPVSYDGLQKKLSLPDARFAACVHDLLYRGKLTKDTVEGESVYSLTEPGRDLMKRASLATPRT